MSKVWGLLLGLAVGAAFGAVLVILFSPASGEKFRHQLQQGWNETLDEARQAAG
ncbi:YtxH domain-containing protein, partial [Anaerolineae bacterium CFX9]|nr:YtxH domain-containing protein [Anaerolineae bacterium CFX9]